MPSLREIDETLVFSERTLNDLEGILSYISRDKPAAAIEFIGELQDQCEALCGVPGAGTLREDLAERMRLYSYRGYGIYFRDLEDKLRIERVLHGAMDVGRGDFK
jgi:toxin ParE1/3/4